MKDEEMVHKLRAANGAVLWALAHTTEATLIYNEIKDQTGHDFQEGQFCREAYKVLRKAVFKDPGGEQSTEFVSNSSCTSFCVVGKRFPLNKFNLQPHEESWFGKIKKVQEDLKISYSYIFPGLDNYPYDVFIGMPLDTMRLDQTRKEFHQQVLRLVENVDPNATIDDIICYQDQGRILRGE